MSDAYLDYIEEVSIEIADFNPIGPTAHIPLSRTMPKRTLHPVKVHPERNPHRLYGGFVKELNMDNILIPVPVSTPVYKKFEENNPEISLCVYKWHNQNECLEFHYVSERRGNEYKQVNLLVITEDDRSHYCIIKDLHKLVYNHSKHKGRKYICRYCLYVYFTEKRFKEHLPKCKGLNEAPQRPKVPGKDNNEKYFYNYKCMQPNPYQIIWDLEMLTEKLTPEEKTKLTSTEIIRMDSSLNYEIINHDLYRRPNALERFVLKIKDELLAIQEDLSAPADIIMAPGDLEAFKEAKEYWICKGPFLKPSPEALQKFEEAKHRLLELNEWEASMGEDHPEKKEAQKKYKEALSRLNHIVKDHDHINGYDSHPLMKVVSKFTADKLKCIPENIGKYKAMDVEQLRFLNSFQHVEMGLDKLVEYLDRKIEKFPLTDMNALYSGAMTQYMPTEILGKVSPEEVPDIQKVPVHLHDYFADYPLAPEKQIVPENWLSLYNERLSPWMKDYIEENIRKRKIAKANGDKFGVMYYKLKNNAVFGKQMENVRKHMRVEILRTEEDKKIRRLASSLLFVGFKQFDGGITAVHMLKSESVCLKPKMYSVLPAGHDPKTPKTEADYEKELEEEEFRKSQGIKYWEKKHGIQKAKGVKKCVVKRELRHDKFLECLRNKKLTRHDMYGLRSYDHQIYLERVNMIGKYDNLAKNYGDYLKKLRAEKDPNNYIKTLAVKMFPKEEAYTERLENYRKRYEDNDLYSSLEELYMLYYQIAREENRERSDEEIEQMLKAMAI
ncbi:9397_t:CDS:2 [Gigaspora margarita]|uniref:9397_t:CDS:1 n=1 Tax=Gigaspora margarita TaxID=4874 RepID=A0ABM8VWI4_GIGMA|nr:9397_t:CDS:2 [Gigaspora margarita]